MIEYFVLIIMLVLANTEITHPLLLQIQQNITCTCQEKLKYLYEMKDNVNELIELKSSIEEKRDRLEKLEKIKKLKSIHLTLVLFFSYDWEFVQRCPITINDETTTSYFGCQIIFNKGKSLICNNSVNKNSPNDYAGKGSWEVTPEKITIFEMNFTPAEGDGASFRMKSGDICTSELIAVPKTVNEVLN